MANNIRTPLSERFLAKVDKNGPNGCWIWLGAIDTRGYGQLRAPGRKGKLLKAHRVSWELKHGPIPDGLFVCHRCDNPPCTNDDHLFLGTQVDNIQDMLSKGRSVAQQHPEKHPRGMRVHGAKLSDEQVEELRRLSSEGWSQPKLAARYGVSQQAIWYRLRSAERDAYIQRLGVRKLLHADRDGVIASKELFDA